MCDVHPVSCLVSAGGSFLRGKMYLELEADDMPPSNVKFNVTYRNSFTVHVHFLCNNNLCHRLYISCLDCNEQHFLTHTRFYCNCSKKSTAVETVATEGRGTGTAVCGES